MTKTNVPIKFRAWKQEAKQMLVDGVEFEYQEVEIAVANSKTYLLDSEPYAHSKNYVVMQFTGLLDSKKKEIWEGDLVQINGVVYEVVKKPGVFWLVDAAGNEWSALHVQNFKILEVIGNKYENPELFK